MQKVATHVGLDVHSERIVIATLTGASRHTAAGARGGTPAR